MRKPSQLYAKQLKQVYAAIEAAEAGGPASVTIRGTTYSTIEGLYQIAELVRLDAAIAAIEEGAQSYTIDDHTFSRAQYRDLCERRDVIVRRANAASRGGIRVRNVVPVP
jgi:hypothetical protein